jgi:sulfite exporter TauE/SafE
LSAPISDPVIQAILPSGILIASLLGSAHCVSMCGGLVISFAKDAKSLALYQFGRLLSYALLGALAGALGNAIFKASFARQAPWISSVIFGLVLILTGVRRLSGKSLHITLPKLLSTTSSKLISRVLKHTESHSGVFLLGALSALLPCGWLYTFVLAASATKSAALGAASLTLFWVGTVPALSAVPMVFNKTTGKVRRVNPRIAGALMISLGLFALSMHATSLFAVAHDTDAKEFSPPTCLLHHQ